MYWWVIVITGQFVFRVFYVLNMTRSGEGSFVKISLNLLESSISTYYIFSDNEFTSKKSQRIWSRLLQGRFLQKKRTKSIRMVCLFWSLESQIREIRWSYWWKSHRNTASSYNSRDTLEAHWLLYSSVKDNYITFACDFILSDNL